jgi:hypothetical protein
MHKEYIPEAGEDIKTTAKRMALMCQTADDQVVASFNDIELVAKFGMKPAKIVSTYHALSKKRHEKYINSDEYKEQQLAQQKEHALRLQNLKAELKEAPVEPTFKDRAGWMESCRVNKDDDYGSAVNKFAELWMRLMEGQINQGNELSNCAKDMCHLANTEIGITGFMYGCAVSLISQVWQHGEELRRWHNLDTQLGTEGEKANESGGVLNPALLNISA